MGYLAGWTYRKSHVVNPASGAGTNYQIRIKVHYGSGTDSGADVYLNGKCRTDFGDIRFRDYSDVVLLDYWMEEKVDGNYAVFWVEVADDLSTNPATIYVYYGNPSAVTTSNGANTFIEFHDFNSFTGTATNPTWAGWTTVDKDTNPAWQGDIQAKTDRVWEGAYSVWKRYGVAHLNRTITALQNVCVEVKVNVDVYGTAGGDEAAMLGADDGTTARIFGYLKYKSSSYYSYRIGTTYYETTTPLKPADEWHTFGIGSISSGSRFLLDHQVIASTANVINVSRISFGSWWNGDDSTIAYFDTLYIRKFVYPEPAHGAWGSEEIKGVMVVARDQLRVVDFLAEASYGVAGFIVRRVVFHRVWGDIIEPEDHNVKVDICKDLLVVIKRVRDKLKYNDNVTELPFEGELEMLISELEGLVGMMEYVKKGDYVYARHKNIFIDWLNKALPACKALYEWFKLKTELTLPKAEDWISEADSSLKAIWRVKHGDVVSVRDHNMLIDVMKLTELILNEVEKNL